MKLKDILTLTHTQNSTFHKKYEDFVNDTDTQINSIEIDENGNIISNKLSILRFVDWLLKQYDNCSEKKQQ